MRVKNIFGVLSLALIFAACNNKADKKIAADNLKAEMFAAENAFSLLSEKVGTKKAFMQFIDSNGVLLRPNSFPLLGADAVDFISQTNDSAYTITWKPRGGTVAVSGDLGYTYGVYAITPKSNEKALYGTYVNVWKKQVDGSWKILLDSGNEGIDN